MLKNIDKGSTMIELGAYWSFYSMWFKRAIPESNVYMIEPESENLEVGKINFKENKFEGNFYQYFISDEIGENTISVDSFIEEQGIQSVDILHSDIQGFEFLMLKGAIKSIEKRKIKYVFVSTHSNKLHYECIEFLESCNFMIIDHLDLEYSDSYDGIIIAKMKNEK